MIKPGQRFGHLLTLKQTENHVRCYCDCGFILDVPASQLLSGKKTDCGCGTGLPPPNLLGNRYGRLVVKQWSYQEQSYLCQCDCGKELVLPLNTILKEKPRSCGCLTSTNPILGQKFGSLTPIENDGLIYKCLCTCGSEILVSFDDLFWGTVTSCGCQERIKKSNVTTGQTFGQLTVLREVSPGSSDRKAHYRRFLVQCQCGRESIMLYSNLRKSGSCGCSSGSLVFSLKRSSSLAGQVFSNLTVLEEVLPVRSYNGFLKRRYLCECVCGSLVITSQNNLITGATKSCGCRPRIKSRVWQGMDLTGQHFGKLTVVSEAESKYTPCGKRVRKWNVVCECGTKRTFYQRTLRKGKTLSCGCVSDENPVGKKYGYLTVLETIPGDDELKVRCICDCGKIVVFPFNVVRLLKRISCGCIKRLDLTGMVFGDLTVLREADPIINDLGYSIRQWECICLCGKTITVYQTSLRSGDRTHCGCKNRKKVDLTGQRFGMNTVIKEAEESGQRRIWLVRCDCGKIRNVTQSTLLSGESKSCGCVNKKTFKHVMIRPTP